MKTAPGLLLGVCSIALAVLATSSHVAAHALYERSEPAEGATVHDAPTQVKVWFTEKVAAEGTMLSVWNAAGQQVDRKDSTRAAGNDHLVAVSLNAGLPEGVYTVQWKAITLEGDHAGHETSGEFPFTVEHGAPMAQPQAATSGQAAPDHAHDHQPAQMPNTGDSFGWWMGSMGLLGLGMTRLGLFLRRRAVAPAAIPLRQQ